MQCRPHSVFGIDADRAVDYIPDAKGTQLNFEAMAENGSLLPHDRSGSR